MNIPKENESKLIKAVSQIPIRPSKEFEQAEKGLADYIQTLGLSEADLTRLADMIMKFTAIGQDDALRQGIQCAVDLLNDEKDLPVKES
ncbi:MAG: hypothetical protein ACOYB8_08045 [Eubacteriaceae bacterium]|jgi:hypothetical protein